MIANRSIPRSTVIPELAYPDVQEAAAWLCRAFGFVERLRIANHRIQLTFGDGAIVVTERRGDPSSDGSNGTGGGLGHSVMVRVTDVDEHFRNAESSGARILNPPTSHPYG